mmetsp:Transcript_9270/g.22791  ORF Transcript_9270/g.22791 Transcript_9270/m.22791 type:complete len:130 (-) Transcript_9270:795-1184(-)
MMYERNATSAPVSLKVRGMPRASIRKEVKACLQKRNNASSTSRLTTMLLQLVVYNTSAKLFPKSSQRKLLSFSTRKTDAPGFQWLAHDAKWLTPDAILSGLAAVASVGELQTPVSMLSRKEGGAKDLKT